MGTPLTSRMQTSSGTTVTCRHGRQPWDQGGALATPRQVRGFAGQVDSPVDGAQAGLSTGEGPGMPARQALPSIGEGGAEQRPGAEEVQVYQRRGPRALHFEEVDAAQGPGQPGPQVGPPEGWITGEEGGTPQARRSAVWGEGGEVRASQQQGGEGGEASYMPRMHGMPGTLGAPRQAGGWYQGEERPRERTPARPMMGPNTRSMAEALANAAPARLPPHLPRGLHNPLPYNGSYNSVLERENLRLRGMLGGMQGQGGCSWSQGWQQARRIPPTDVPGVPRAHYPAMGHSG